MAILGLLGGLAAKAKAVPKKGTTHIIRDPEGEMMVINIGEECRARGQKFVDPEFPAGNRALFRDPQKPAGLPSVEMMLPKIEWKRPCEMGDISEATQVFADGISPEDINQGILGDCYLLAALSVCASDEALISDLIVENAADAGVLGVKFHVMGKWQTVIIDDLFPCIKGADGCWHPIFSSWKGPKEIWAMAAEKAWAKLHGSYETVEAGSAEDTLAYLTGGCSETYRTGVWAGREDKLWETCLAAYKTASSEQGLFLAAGDANGLSTNNRMSKSIHVDSNIIHSDSEDGLVAGHAYSVLGLKVVDGFMLINLRNPWGKGEWTGAWSDQSELWTPTRRKQAGFVGVADDGSFWMAWPDFMKHFGHIGLCRLPPRKWHVVSCQGAFQTGKTAGGEDSPTVACNPTFYLENTVDQVEVVVEQPDSRSNTGPGYHPIGLRVLKLPADGDKIEANPPTALPMQQTGFNRQTRYTLQLDPREGPYLLLFTLWRSGVTHRVHVTAASPQPIKMKKTKQYRPKISTEMAAKMKAPKMPIGCVTCGKPAFGDHIAALYGLRWHKASACCRCEACKKPFTQDAGHSLYMPGVEAGRWGVYCWGCHNDKFGKKCVQCGEKLHMLQADGEKVYLIPSGEGKLHGRCRDEYAKAKAEPCTQCKKPLSGKYYVLEGDVKVHDECYVVFKVAAAKKCLHCSEPVFAIPGKYEGKYYVTKDGAQIHEECYAAHLRSQAPECIQCHETIVDSEYFKIDGGAKGCVHKACYEMYKIGQAPQCVHCRGAILELTGKYSGRYYDLKEKGKVHEECYHDFKKGPIMQGV